MSGALVAAWVVPFVAPVCLKLLERLAIRYGLLQETPTPTQDPANTQRVLEEINARAGRISDNLEELTQAVGRST
jgi:hypothetical protein